MRSASVVNARPSKNSSGHMVHGAPHTRRVHSIARARAIVAWLPCMASSQQRVDGKLPSVDLLRKSAAPRHRVGRRPCTGGHSDSGARCADSAGPPCGMCTFTNAALTWRVTGATTHPHRGGQDTLSMAPAFLVCQGSPEFIRTWLQHADTDAARQRPAASQRPAAATPAAVAHTSAGSTARSFRSAPNAPTRANHRWAAHAKNARPARRQPECRWMTGPVSSCSQRQPDQGCSGWNWRPNCATTGAIAMGDGSRPMIAPFEVRLAQPSTVSLMRPPASHEDTQPRESRVGSGASTALSWCCGQLYMYHQGWP
jgi:hypothetical protein